MKKLNLSTWKAAMTGKNKRAAENSAVAMALTAIALVCVIAVNLLMQALPANLTSFDISAQKLYTLGSSSRQLVSTIEQPVTIYYLVQEGQEDTNVATLLECYRTAGTQVTVQEIDPAANPSFVEEYGIGDASEGSLLVECGGKTKLVDASTFYLTEYDYDTADYDVSFDLEQQVTSAIRYATSESSPVVYRLTGHGEADLTDSMETTIANQNLELKDFSPVSAEEAPADAAAMLLLSPTTDYTQHDIEVLEAYLKQGGSLIVVTSPTKQTPNLDGLLEEYGLQRITGMVLEGDGNYCVSGYNYYLLPAIEMNEFTQGMENRFVLLPGAQAAEIDNAPDEVEVTPLLMTSASAYNKEDYTVGEETDEDKVGPFVLAAVSENLSGGSLLWVGSDGLLNESVDSYVSGGNSLFFVGALSALAGQEDHLVIEAKSLQTEGLVVPNSAILLWGTVFAVAIPLGLVIAGLVITLRRRRR